MVSASSLKKQVENIADQYGRQVISLADQAKGRVSSLAAGQSANRAWWAAVFFAFGFGLVVGMLTAPRTGKETREKISRQAKNVTSMANLRKSAPEQEKEISIIG